MLPFLTLFIPVTQAVIELPQSFDFITITDKATGRVPEMVLGNRTTGVKVIGDDSDNRVTVSSSLPIELDLGRGFNTVYGIGTGSLVIRTESGQDSISVSKARRAIVYSGHGNDTVIISTGEIYAGDGDDSMTSENGNSILSGGEGNNFANSKTSRDTIVLDRLGYVTISNYKRGITKISRNGIPFSELEINGGWIRHKGLTLAVTSKPIDPSDIID